MSRSVPGAAPGDAPITAAPGARRAPGTWTDLPGSRAMFTARGALAGPFAGRSRGSFASFDLARHVGDDPADVEANRDRLAATIGAPVRFVDQIHSAHVAVARSADDPDATATADALVTAETGIALAILVADCMPVLLSDPEAGVIAAAHAGRAGLLAGVLEATVGAMAELEADPARIRAVVGPHACGRCYEVPARMRDDSEELIPGIGGRTSWGTPSLDLERGARTALGHAGVPADAVGRARGCTIEDERFFSYRRRARTGRFAGVIVRA